ncbi:hypothetical protein EK904_014278 [Melospiza melodia maxima]|nr:hypothetical protein EK904_014278 [Melospiza melodia maxima]
MCWFSPLGLAAEGDALAAGPAIAERCADVCGCVMVSLHKPEIKLESLKEDIKDFLKTSGWEKKLQNAVYSELNVFPWPCHPAAPPEHIKEPLAYMRKAQGSWEKRILKSLNSMCTELNIPLAQKRPANEQKELLNKWNEMGTDEPDLSLFRPVYAPKDFLEKEDFSELGLNIGQLGIDDSAQVPPEFFENEHVRVGQKVLAEQDSAAAQQYVRQGCPTALRADLWALILNISNQPEELVVRQCFVMMLKELQKDEGKWLENGKDNNEKK